MGKITSEQIQLAKKLRDEIAEVRKMLDNLVPEIKKMPRIMDAQKKMQLMELMDLAIVRIKNLKQYQKWAKKQVAVIINETIDNRRKYHIDNLNSPFKDYLKADETLSKLGEEEHTLENWITRVVQAYKGEIGLKPIPRKKNHLAEMLKVISELLLVVETKLYSLSDNYKDSLKAVN